MDHPSSSKRKFEECWEELYLLTQQNGDIYCLVCQRVLPSKWFHNLKRHYNSCHARQYENLSRDERLETIERLKGNLIEEKENQSEDVSFYKFVLEYLMLISYFRTYVYMYSIEFIAFTVGE